MTDQTQQPRTPVRGRTAKELEAAEALLLLARYPREFGARPTAGEVQVKREPELVTPQKKENAPQAQPTPPATQPAPPARVPAGVQAGVPMQTPARLPRQNASQRTAPRNTTIENIALTPEQALQTYLLRQQYIAGIPPEQMTSMHRLRASGQPNIPALVQITNDGVVFPRIPPAQFNGPFHPLPIFPPEFADARASASAEARRMISAPESRERLSIRPNPQSNTPQHRTPAQSRSGINSTATPPVSPQGAPEPPRRPSRHRRTFAVARWEGLHSSEETNDVPKEKFNIIEALTKNPEICLEVIGYLGPAALLQLYSVSKSFHVFVNGHFIDAIMNVASRCAPEAALLYPGRCYPRLCISPPRTGKVPPPLIRFALLPAKVPSIRWLFMITYREQVTEGILSTLAKVGYELPERCGLVIKKVWFLMDIPDNTRRMWTVQNKNIWPDIDLFLAVLFFVKLEMYLEAVYGEKCNLVRRLLLARPSLSLLYNVICKTALTSDFDIFQEYLRWKYLPLPHEMNMDIFEVPAAQIGRFQYEAYGKRGLRVPLFQTPDELILRECVARGLDVTLIHVDFFFSDYRVPIEFSGAQEEGGGEPTWAEEIEKDGRGKDMNRFDVVVIE